MFFVLDFALRDQIAVSLESTCLLLSEALLTTCIPSFAFCATTRRFHLVRKIATEDIWLGLCSSDRLDTDIGTNSCSSEPTNVRKSGPGRSSYVENADDASVNSVVDVVSNTSNHDVREEVLKFPSSCPTCTQPVETRMTMVEIPNFKEVSRISVGALVSVCVLPSAVPSRV